VKDTDVSLSFHADPGGLLKIFLLGSLLLFAGLGATPVINGDEARFAVAAREMRAADTLVLPTFAGRPRYDKPILIYWATIASYSLFGETALAARMPSAIATLAAALLLGLFAENRWGSGFRAAFLFLITPLLFFEARACTADALNNLWILAAMLCLFLIWNGEGKGWIRIAFWISTALALLSKGPVILLVIAGCLAGIQALRRQWKSLEMAAAVLLLGIACFGGGPLFALPVAAALILEFLYEEGRNPTGVKTEGKWLLPGFLLLLAVVTPWLWEAQRASGGEFLKVALGRHVIRRSLETLEHHQGFPGMYILAFFILAFPWAAGIPRTIRRVWRSRKESREILFLLAWLLGPLFLLESMKTRLVHYEMPLLAAGILLIVRSRDSRPHRGLLLFGGSVLALLPLFPVLHFDLPGLLLPAAILSILLLSTSLALILQPESRRLGHLLEAATAIYLVGLLGLFLPALSKNFIAPRSLGAARSLAGEGNHFVVYKLRDEDLLFELPVNTRVLNSASELAAYLKEPEAAVMITREKDWKRLAPAIRQRLPAPDISIRGIDLGRGRWTTALCFRLGSKEPAGAEP